MLALLTFRKHHSPFSFSVLSSTRSAKLQPTAELVTAQHPGLTVSPTCPSGLWSDAISFFREMTFIPQFTVKVHVKVLVTQRCLTLWLTLWLWLYATRLLCQWNFLGKITLQAPLSLGFSRQEYWSGFPFPFSGDFPDPGIEPRSPDCRQILYCLSHLGTLHLSSHHCFIFIIFFWNWCLAYLHLQMANSLRSGIPIT